MRVFFSLLAGLAMALAAVQVEAQAPTKKELAQKIVQAQQPAIEALARRMAEEPAARMLQEVSRVVQTQVPLEKREQVVKAIEASAKRYIEGAAPVLRERALKLAPSTFGTTLEEKFSQDELKQLLAWLESPLMRRYLALGPVLQNSLVQKLVAEGRPIIEPKAQVLEQEIRNILNNAFDSAGPPASGSADPAKGPSKSASR